MDACKVYRLGTVKVEHSMTMESLSYENATPLDVAPPPLHGDVWILGRRYSLPKGIYIYAAPRSGLFHCLPSIVYVLNYRKNRNDAGCKESFMVYLPKEL